MHVLTDLNLTQKQRSQAILKAAKSGEFDKEWGEHVTFEDLVTRSEHSKAIIYHMIDHEVFHFLRPDILTVNLLLVRMSDNGTPLEYAKFKRKLEYFLRIVYDTPNLLKAVRGLCRIHKIIATRDMKMKTWKEDPIFDLVDKDEMISHG